MSSCGLPLRWSCLPVIPLVPSLGAVDNSAQTAGASQLKAGRPEVQSVLISRGQLSGKGYAALHVP